MSSVLETFFILFESDAEDVKKGAKEAQRPVQDLENDIKKTDDVSVQLGKSFGNLAAQAIGAFAGVFAITSLISQSGQIIQRTDDIAKFSQSLGEGIGMIDAWSEAVVRAGGDANGFQSSIEQLNEKVVEASLKGMNEIVPFFNQLGISIVDANGKARSTLDLLPELADAFQKISKQESLGIGRRLGLDRATILLLQQGRAEVELLVDRQKKLGVVTQEQADITQKFVDQWSDFKQQSSAGSREIIVSILPALNSMLQSFERFIFFLDDHEDLVTGFFIAVGTAITAFALPALISLGTWVLVVAAPFLLLVAAIGAAGAALTLLYEDFKVFQSGGDSLFGKLLEDFPILEKVNNILGEIKDTFLDLIGLGKGESIFKTIFDAVFGKKEKNLNQPLFNSGGDIPGIEPIPDGDINSAINKGAGLLSQASASPIASLSSSSIANSAQTNSRQITVEVGDINITPQTVGDIPSSVGDALRDQIKTAVDNFDDGIEA